MNRSKRFFILLGCTVLGIGCIVLLDFISDQVNEHPNGFLRKFPSHPFKNTAVKDLTYNSFYICGMRQHRIYLGNQKSPLYMLSVSTSLKDTSRIFLRQKLDLKFTQARLSMDSSCFYLSDGAAGVIFSTPIEGSRYLTSIFPQNRFLDALPLNNQTFVLRYLNASKQSALGLFSMDAANSRLFQAAQPGTGRDIFSSDGMLRAAPRLNKIVYCYYYRNEFLVFDSNLNLQIKGKTIDTVHVARIKSDSLPSEKSIMLSAPPLLVNKKSSLSDKYLFINSALIADNEKPEIFRESSVIDVYDLKTGIYKFSFHLYDHAGKKMRDFAVTENKLVALHDHYMIVYDLNLALFK